jgi:hypothetical protein
VVHENIPPVIGIGLGCHADPPFLHQQSSMLILHRNLRSRKPNGSRAGPLAEKHLA